jgi:hypothetical protein
VYVGEDLILKVKVSNPITGRVARDSAVTVRFYNPTKDPADDLDDRADPDSAISLTFNTSIVAYYAKVSTVGWDAGVWTMLVEVTGELAGHTYHRATLTAA